jgi:hypothetical protein
LNLATRIQYPKTISSFNGFVTEWLILLTCFGYPFQAMVVLYSGIDSTPINLAFRAIYLTMSIYLILWWLFQINPLNKQNWYGSGINILLVVFFLFWVIYGVRLVYDLEYKGWQLTGYHKYYVYAWAFGCSMIPALAALVNAKNINIKRLTKNMLFFILLSNLCLAAYLINIYKYGFQAIFIERVQIFLPGEAQEVKLLPDELKKASTVLINGITLGFYGCLLGIASISYFLFYQRKLSIWSTFFLTAAFLLGVFNLMAGASRGPFLSFVLLFTIVVLVSILITLFRIVYFLYLKIRVKVTGMRPNVFFQLRFKPVVYKMMMTFLGLLLIFTLFNFAKERTNIDFDQLGMSTRIKSMQEFKNDGTIAERVSMWKSAMHQFKTNPIFGDSFINNFGNLYSHNLIMDVLMSVGIVGSIPFFIYLLSPFYYFIRLPAEKKRAISVLFVVFLAALMLYMTSGGLFTAAEFWILSAAVIGISQQYLKLET